MNYHPGDPIPMLLIRTVSIRFGRSSGELCGRASRARLAEYLKAIEQLNFSEDRIPQLREVNERVQAISGFRLEPVAGLVQPRVFLENLADGVFLCTQYIRHHSTPLYTPEPDVVHEIVGHGVTLACPQLAELNRLFGEAIKRTTSADKLEQLSRVYWFTIELEYCARTDR
jgi:phenylalanine-4-hydroxylase